MSANALSPNRYNARRLYIFSTIFIVISVVTYYLEGSLLGFTVPLILLSGIGLMFFFISRIEYTLIAIFYSALIGPLGRLLPETSAVPLTIFQVLVLFLFFVIAVNRLQDKIINFEIHKSYYWVFFFLLYLSLSTIYSYDPARAIYNEIALMVLVLLSIFVQQLLLSKNVYKIIFVGTIIIVFALSVYAIVQFINNPEALLLNALNVQSKVFGRQLGVWEDPNDFGIILVLPLLYIIAKVVVVEKFKDRKSSFFYLLSFLVILIALLSTYSRSSWLSLIVGTVFLFIISGNGKKIIYLFFIGIGIIVILSFNDFFYKSITNRLISIFDVSTKNVSNSTRLILANAGLEMFKDSNFFGFGYMSFPKIAYKYFNPIITQNIVESHNVTITLLAELGFLGVIIFYKMIYEFIHKGIIGLKLLEDKCILAYQYTFLSYIIALLVFYQLYPGCFHNNIIWFSLGSILTLPRIDKALKQN